LLKSRPNVGALPMALPANKSFAAGGVGSFLA
jgi:hypothetical protein